MTGRGRGGGQHAWLDSAAPQPTSLQEASRSLWLATLALMTAYMQQQAPAHRYLLARRIARNCDPLHARDCFSPDCRQRFARLGSRWQRTADRLREGPPPRWRLLLERLRLL